MVASERSRRSERGSPYGNDRFVVVFFPANIYAAINHIPMGGHAWGPVYLLIRAPLQVVILLWIYWFTIKRPQSRTASPPQAPVGSNA